MVANSIPFVRFLRAIGICLILCCVASGRSSADVFDVVTGQTKAEAEYEAKLVWSHLGLTARYPFQPRFVEVAYAKLTQKMSKEAAISKYLEFGPFLHLVKQTVMANAAYYRQKLPAAQWFKATSTGIDAQRSRDILKRASRELQKGYPFDPNMLDGPIAISGPTKPANQTADIQTRSLTSGPPPAVPVCSYTIGFENTGTGDATLVIVSDDILTKFQDVASFRITEISWGTELLYPVAAAGVDGVFHSIAAGSLAPVPGNGETFQYRFKDGKLMTLTRKLLSQKVQFIWTFKMWKLTPKESASVSFAIETIGDPSASNVVNPGASIIFNSNAPIATNPWLRPGTAF